MTTPILLLDHGFVRLVSYIQPVPFDRMETTDFEGVKEVRVSIRDGDWTGDLEIVRNARTSHNADWRTGEDEGKDAHLLQRLWNDEHTTPFESMVFTFEVQAPIFVFRQWHRHRTWSYNEVSARYTELPELYYIPQPGQICFQSTKNKQGRSGPLDTADSNRLRIAMAARASEAFDLYHSMLTMGVARETARMVLPLNTYSRMFATVDLRNLFHFLKLRLDEHAQFEIRVYAEALLTLVRDVCPVAVKAFEDEFFAPNGG